MHDRSPAARQTRWKSPTNLLVPNEEARQEARQELASIYAGGFDTRDAAITTKVAQLQNIIGNKNEVVQIARNPTAFLPKEGTPVQQPSNGGGIRRPVAPAAAPAAPAFSPEDYASAKEWESGIVNQIRAQHPNWGEMSREQRQAAAREWRDSLPPEQLAEFNRRYGEFRRLNAQQQAPVAAPQPTQQPQPPQPQPQAGIRPPQQPTAFQLPSSEGEAADYYGAKGYKGGYVQNKNGKWIPGDAEWRHTHTPDGNRRPGIRPGIYGSSPAEIREASLAQHKAQAAQANEAQANAAATTARWQAAENAAAARQRDPTKPYVAGGSFSNDGRTNGEVYEMWRQRHFAGMPGRTLFSTRPSQRAEV